MSIEIGYGIVWFFAAIAVLIVVVQSMRTNRHVTREPVEIAVLACVIMWVSWLQSDPQYAEWIGYAAIGFAVLAAWAAWKDANTASEAMKANRKKR